MARTAIVGFESGALVVETATASVTGSAAIESSIVRTGSYSLKATPASGAAGYWRALTSEFTGTHIRFYLRITTLPSATRLVHAQAANEYGVQVNSSGNLILLKDDGTAVGTSTVALTDTTKWYRIEVQNQGTSGTLELKVDGTVEVTGSNSAGAAGGMPPYFGAADTVAATYTAYYDDITVDDAAYPGAGAVLMLLPASINAANGWVEGDGAGTAGIVGALSTRPPPGLASANETSATNAESPTNSATDNLDLNLTDYTTAGVSGTVNAVQALVRHGEDITTTSKSGAVLIVSNPTQASENTFTFGADAGAHGGEPGNWKTALGTVQDSPSVVLATQPVLRVGKRTATTRVVCVDFMGLYVDYSPTGDQTVSPGLLGSAMATVAPSVTQQVQGTLLGSAATVVAPVIELRASPGLLSAVLSAIAPSRIDQEVLGSLLGQAMTAPAPSIGWLVNVDALAATLGVVSPSRIDQEVAPGLLGQASTALAPQVDQHLSGLALLGQALAVIAPSRVDQQVDPALLGSAATNPAPTVLSDQTVTVALLGTSMAALAPRLDQELDPALLSFAASVLAPSVEQQVATVLLSLSLTVVTPERLDQEVDPGTLAASLSVLSPDIEQQVSAVLLGQAMAGIAPDRIDQEVVAALLGSAMIAVAPTVTTDTGQTVEPVLLSLPLAVVAPERVDQEVSPELLTQTLTVVPLGRVDQEVVASLLGQAMTVLTPEVIQALEQLVSPSLLGEAMAVLSPQVSLSVSPDLLTLLLVVIAPSLAVSGGETPRAYALLLVPHGMARAFGPSGSGAGRVPRASASGPIPEARGDSHEPEGN